MESKDFPTQLSGWIDSIQSPSTSDLATILLIVSAVAILLLFLLLKSRSNGKRLKQIEAKNRELVERFADPIAREHEIAQLDATIQNRESTIGDLSKKIDELKDSYREKKRLFDRLKTEAAIYDDTIQLAELGFYQPHFRFDDSEDYKAAIRACKDRQKAMVQAKKAVLIPTDWVVGGSRAEGRKLENRTIRLTLRAFNNECDAAISAITWRNASSMEKRIRRAFEQINKENEPLNAFLANGYLDLKLDELRLTIEREEKRKEEREALAEARRAEREEKKLLEEKARAEREEAAAEARLSEARAQAEKAVGEELEKLNARIAALQSDLNEAHTKAERAKSMAEQTRMGHVYVISNEGSFGNGVFKIGLTRRLDPIDRIRELGDASVPFSFDTHALIFSDDAPSVEKALHDAFDDCRVNAANMRKEFFRITLDDVESTVKRVAPNAEFYREAEAQEYHETLMLKRQSAEAAEAQEEFPAEL